jgi:uncharacterized protein DUF3597
LLVGIVPLAKEAELYWRKSIVDLMKVLDLDSSLAAHQQLAKEFEIYRRYEEVGADERLAA